MSAVFLKILNMSITAGWLILAVVLVRLPLKKAPKWIACLLWALVAFRLVCPFSLESPFSLIPSRETVPSDIALSQSPEIESGIPAVNDSVNPVLTESFTPDESSGVNPLQIVIAAAAVLWLAGAAAMLLYALVSYWRLKKTLAVTVPAGKGVLACDEVQTPFLLGILRPMIYVPSAMSGELLENVLRHERAHLARRDHWWKPLGFLLLAVHWFNPLCWLAYILFCRDLEMACDERVIRDLDREGVAAYSQALLACCFPKRRVSACPLAFGEVSVKERVKSVLHYKKPAFWIILAAVLVCAVLAVCLLTDPFSSGSMTDELRRSMDSAIMAKNYSSKEAGNYPVWDYEVLRIAKARNKTTVYAVVLYEEYTFDGLEVSAKTGSCVPAAITFDTSAEGYASAYALLEYWEPRDGGYYTKDIRSKFPLGIREKAIVTYGSERLAASCRKAAEDYFGIGQEGESPDLELLRTKYPEYFDLSTFKGLEVYVCQFGANLYSCGVMEGTNRNKTEEEINNLNRTSIPEMRAILSTYDIPKENIFIIPFHHPLSSYYRIFDDAYMELLRNMLLREEG